jgi:periplasmic protein CpxP/Spy
MKEIILSAMLAMFCQVAFCQTPNNQDKTYQAKRKERTPEEKADMQVKRMTQDLALNSDQAAKVKIIVLDRIQKSEAVKQKYFSDAERKAMQQEMKTLRDQKENELKAVLTPEQYAKHQQLREEHKKRKMEQRQKGYKPNAGSPGK